MSLGETLAYIFYFLIVITFCYLICIILFNIIESICKLLIKIYTKYRERRRRQILPFAESMSIETNSNQKEKKYIIIKNPYDHNLSVGTISNGM